MRKCSKLRGEVGGQSIAFDLGEKTLGKRRRSSKAKFGLEGAAMTSLCLFRTHLMESWQGGLKRRRLKITRVAR